MLDSAPVNVILADENLITYANESTMKTLRKLQYLAINVEELIGTNIDVFHRVPSHQRNILSNPNNLPHQATIDIGPESRSLGVAGAR